MSTTNDSQKRTMIRRPMRLSLFLGVLSLLMVPFTAIGVRVVLGVNVTSVKVTEPEPPFEMKSIVTETVATDDGPFVRIVDEDYGVYCLSRQFNQALSCIPMDAGNSAKPFMETNSGDPSTVGPNTTTYPSLESSREE